MNTMPLDVARVVAWAIALGAVVAVAIGYDSLPDTLPLTRWTTAPKSPLVALRVPLVNLMTIGLIELLSLGLRRAEPFNRSCVAVLFLTAAAKAVIEAIGILLLPISFSWTLIPLAAVLFVGLGTAAFLGREFLPPRRWRELQLTRIETAGALALISGIAVLNLPLVLR
jgi:hypothetical protein